MCAWPASLKINSYPRMVIPGNQGISEKLSSPLIVSLKVNSADLLPEQINQRLFLQLQSAASL